MRRPAFFRNVLFLVPFLVLVVDFLGPVIALQKSFIVADFSVQHWPWAKYFYEVMRAGHFPFWTDAMTGGFPLAAEGQVTAFYGLHQILSKLSFWAFYSWSIVLHFLMGSLGFYLYARAMRLSRAAAGFAVLIYAFGSAYAGCFYNTGSLRTLAWLPYLLWLVEKLPNNRLPQQVGRGALIALIVSQMWGAGFAQIALYAFGYAFCAALFNVRKKDGIRAVGVYTVFVVLGTLLAAPQLFLSWELIGQSVRQGESIAFALWGSVPPSGLISLFFPEWGNIQRLSFYAGVPALFMLAAFFVLPRARKDYRPFWLVLFFLALSLGKYNPLYAALIKGLSLTFLRNPSKFLYFAVLPLGLLAGLGLDAFLLAIKRGRVRKMAIPAAVISLTVVLLPAVCRFFWIILRPAWNSLSQRILHSVLSEKGASAKPAAEYENFLNLFYERLGELFSYTQPNTLMSVGLAAACGALIGLALWKKIDKRIFLGLFFFLAVLDFHHYGWNLGTGFIGNTDLISKAEPDERIQFLQQAAAADPGSVGEFVLDAAHEFLPPNRTMAYGLAHIGGYSPLLLKSYEELVRDLGLVDGSLGRPPFLESTWIENRGLLDLIGLKFLAADSVLSWPGLTEMKRVGVTVFYRNNLVLPAAGAWTHARSIPDAAERLNFLKSTAYDPRGLVVTERDTGLPAAAAGVFSHAEIERWQPGRMRATYVLPSAGVGWVRIAAYPGWKLRVDGVEQSWFRVNHAFIGFRLEEGAHLVELSYVPSFYRRALALSGLAALIVLACLFPFLFKRQALIIPSS